MAMDMDMTSSSAMAMTTTAMDMGSSTTMDMDMATSSAMDMDMSSSSTSSAAGSSCAMSMLFNYLVSDLCILSDGWQVKSKSQFGGSCVGVFLIVIVTMYVRQLMLIYRQECGKQGIAQVKDQLQQGLQLRSVPELFANKDLKSASASTDITAPLSAAFGLSWFWRLNSNRAVIQGDQVLVYPTIPQHIFYTILDTIEDAGHYIIMLTYMYFEVYLIASSIIGALVGYVLFHYRATRADVSFSPPTRCCL